MEEIDKYLAHIEHNHSFLFYVADGAAFAAAALTLWHLSYISQFDFVMRFILIVAKLSTQ